MNVSLQHEASGITQKCILTVGRPASFIEVLRASVKVGAGTLQERGPTLAGRVSLYGLPRHHAFSPRATDVSPNLKVILTSVFWCLRISPGLDHCVLVDDHLEKAFNLPELIAP
jgi:hypothetical protein